MKRYQAMAFLLSTAMTVSSISTVFGAASDINGHWAETTIAKWQSQGRIGGYEDGTFKPDRTITRAEFVRLLNSASPNSFTSSTDVTFSDVSESDWFYADVSKAVGSKITSGFEDGTFRPSETVTRMQAAVFISNAKGLAANEAAAERFSDSENIPNWAKGAVGAVVSAGYMSGYPDGSFGGTKGMTRAEAVSTLDRVIGNTPNTPADMNQGVSTDDNTIVAEGKQEGNMVWTSGGSSSKKKSSSGGGGGGSTTTPSKPETPTFAVVSEKQVIDSQQKADELKNKRLTGGADIYIDSNGIDLENINFDCDVNIYADETVSVASVYDNIAVAKAYIGVVPVTLVGDTDITGVVRIIRNGIPDTCVVIQRRGDAARKIGKVVAQVATKISGMEVEEVEAQASVEVEDTTIDTITVEPNTENQKPYIEVADNAEVNNIVVNADIEEITVNNTGANGTNISVSNGATVDNIATNDGKVAVKVEGEGTTVSNVEVAGNADTKVTVNDNATVDNVAVSGEDNAKVEVTAGNGATVNNVKANGNASAAVTVEEGATVNKVELSDTATGNITANEGGTISKVESTSTASGTTVTGDGTVGEIIAADKETIKNETDTEVKEEKLTAIRISTQPKTSYTIGQELDLSRLTVELTYTGTETRRETVSFKDFAANGISVSLANGTELTKEHNGVKITVKVGGFAVETNALKVTAQGGNQVAESEVTAEVTTGNCSIENKIITPDAAVAFAFKDSTYTANEMTVTLNGTEIQTQGTDLDLANCGEEVKAGDTLVITLKGTNEDGQEKTVTVTLTVTEEKLSVSIKPASITIAKGANGTLQADVTSNYGEVLDDSNINYEWKFTKEDGTELNDDENDGFYISTSSGLEITFFNRDVTEDVAVIASIVINGDENIKATANVTLSANEAEMSKLVIVDRETMQEVKTLDIYQTEDEQFLYGFIRATACDKDGNFMDDPKGSDYEEIVTDNAGGLIKKDANDEIKILADEEGKGGTQPVKGVVEFKVTTVDGKEFTASLTVNVYPARVLKIQATGSNYTLANNNTTGIEIPLVMKDQYGKEWTKAIGNVVCNVISNGGVEEVENKFDCAIANGKLTVKVADGIADDEKPAEGEYTIQMGTAGGTAEEAAKYGTIIFEVKKPEPISQLTIDIPNLEALKNALVDGSTFPAFNEGDVKISGCTCSIGCGWGIKNGGTVGEDDVIKEGVEYEIQVMLILTDIDKGDKFADSISVSGVTGATVEKGDDDTTAKVIIPVGTAKPAANTASIQQQPDTTEDAEETPPSEKESDETTTEPDNGEQNETPETQEPTETQEITE